VAWVAATAGKTCRRLTAALIEPDPDWRARELSELLDEEVIVQSGDQTMVGRDEVSNWVSRQLQDWAYTRETIGRPGAVEDGWTFRWRVGSSKGVREHSVFAEFLDGPPIRRLVSQPAGDGAPLGMWRRMREWAFQNPLPAGAVVAGVAYAFLRVPVGIFYGELGVTLEQVGFGTQELVRQGLLLLATLVAAAAAAPIVVWQLSRLVNWMTAAKRLHTMGRLSAADVMRHLAPFVLAPILGVVAGMLVDVAFGFLIAFYTVLGLILGVPWPALQRSAAMVRDRDRRRRGEQQRALVFLFAGVLLYAVVFPPLVATWQAEDVIDGGEVSSLLVPWQARHAELRWKHDAAVVGVHNSCEHLRYLGSADKRVVVYDSAADEAIIIPESEVSVAVMKPDECRRRAAEQVDAPAGGFPPLERSVSGSPIARVANGDVARRLCAAAREAWPPEYRPVTQVTFDAAGAGRDLACSRLR
jgi:hypothetical protein